MVTSYTVSSSGLTETDFASLHGLLACSSTSDRVYYYLGEGVYEADIIIVNADSDDSMQKAIDGRNAFENSIGSKLPPAIVAQASAVPGTMHRGNRIQLKLPIVNSRVVPLLDLLVIDRAGGYDDRRMAESRRVSMPCDYRSTAAGT